MLEPTRNEMLYEKAKEAASALFCDMSVSQQETRENLGALIGEIQVMLESLPE
jgi:hypothetical protein